jgi:hypothetical protein
MARSLLDVSHVNLFELYRRENKDLGSDTELLESRIEFLDEKKPEVENLVTGSL